MTTIHHSPHPFLGPLTSAAVNAPLGQLDAAIVAADAAIVALARVPTIVVRASGGDDLAELNAASVPGYDVVLTDDLYLVDDQWWISASRCHVILSPATTIRANAAITGAVVRIGAATTPEAAVDWCDWSSFEGGTIDTAGIATQGLLIMSAENTRVSRLRIIGPNGAGETGLLIKGYDLAYSPASDPRNAYNRTTGLITDKIEIVTTGDAEPFHVGSGTATQSGATYNCTFRNLSYQHVGSTLTAGVGGFISQCDDLRFYDIKALCTGSARSLELAAGATASWQPAHHVQFFGGYPLRTNGTIVRGGTGLYPAHDITFHGLSKIDSTNQITVEAGAGVRFDDSDGNSTFVPDDRSLVLVREDFISASVLSGTIGEYCWRCSAVGAITKRDGEAGHYGILRVGTDGTLNQIAYVTLEPLAAATADLAPTDNWMLTYKFKLTQVDSSTIFRIGLCVAAGAATSGAATPGAAGDGPQGFYLEKLNAEGNFHVVSEGATTYTRTNTGVTPSAATWYTLRIRLRSTGIIGYSVGNTYVNNQDGVTISTNLPTANLNLFAQIQNVNAAAAKSFDLDLAQLVITGGDR